MASSISENFRGVCDRVRELEHRYRRPAGSVTVLAVSKTHPAECIEQARNAGARHFGENYAQEGIDKIRALARTDMTWHFIGPVQSNKTRDIARHFDWLQSLDRIKIARRLSEQRPAELGPLDVCVQVNLSGEASKSGVLLDEAESLCRHTAELPGLRLRGLMAIPAPADTMEAQRAAFRPLAQLYRELTEHFPAFDTLSMGMSADHEAAIAEGSTMVRMGTAIFGPRPA